MKKVVYPEVHSLEESLAILKKYKNELTKEQYGNLVSSIRNVGLSGGYVNENTILETIELAKGNISLEQSKEMALKRMLE